MGNAVFSILEELQRWTWPVDCRNSVASCKGGDWRLLNKDFESKPIKRWGKIPFWQFKENTWHSTMAQQFTTTPTSPNPYVSRRLNNMKEANLFKKECNDWITNCCKV